MGLGELESGDSLHSAPSLPTLASPAVSQVLPAHTAEGYPEGFGWGGASGTHLARLTTGSRML